MDFYQNARQSLSENLLLQTTAHDYVTRIKSQEKLLWYTPQRYVSYMSNITVK